MANSAVEPEFDLKKRLVGAFVLIGFGVVVLPALLGGKGPNPGEEDSTVTPRLDSKVFVSKITPIGGATPQRLPEKQPAAPTQPVQPEAGSEPPAVTTESPKQTARTDPAPEPAPKPVTEKKTEPKTVAPSATDEPGWVVRVGTFAQTNNVERVVKRLQQAGFEPSTTQVKTQQGSVTRVWIGPYSKRVEAARMRTRVKQVTGGEGYIAAYP